jgi:hypothetical protein
VPAYAPRLSRPQPAQLPPVSNRTSIALRAGPRPRLVVTIADESRAAPARRVEYFLQPCASATCSCRDLALLEAGGDDAANDHDRGRSPRVEFLFDVLTKAVRPAEDDPSATKQLAAATLTAAVPAPIVDQLVAVFFDAKARAFEDFDGTRFTADFPFDEVEQNGTLVRLRQVIPFAPRLAPPAIDGRELIVDEQYCVRPRCTCSCTVVGISELTPEDRDELHRESHRVVDFRIDWQRDQWSVAGREGPPAPSELPLRQALLAANPDLFATLQRRHRMMQTLYATSAAAAGRPRSRPEARPAVGHGLPKVGRNDPCPCGSGKKAKRCCQSAGGPRTDLP